jgi:hypothetical protein
MRTFLIVAVVTLDCVGMAGASWALVDYLKAYRAWETAVKQRDQAAADLVRELRKI